MGKPKAIYITTPSSFLPANLSPNEETGLMCHIHANREAVSTDSSCGQPVCNKCAETESESFPCRLCAQTRHSQRNTSFHRRIGAFLGWLGAVNSFTTGFYITTTYFEIARFSRKTAQDLLTQVCAATISTAAFTLVLAYGSYLIWKGNTRKGGVLNIIIGVLLIPIIVYFALFSQPRLIEWLGPVGAFLCVPAILSGTIGIMINK